jgi:DNA-binding transcriptional MerR regulator
MAKTSDGPLRSGELARVSGVSADALRVYERRGLLPKPPRSSAGYRFYPREAVRRVQLIRGALSLGFSLEEMGELLTERDRGGVPCKKARRLAQEKLERIDEDLQTLRALRKILNGAIEGWGRKIASSPADARLGLLEAFISANPGILGRTSPLMPRGLRDFQKKEKRK